MGSQHPWVSDCGSSTLRVCGHPKRISSFHCQRKVGPLTPAAFDQLMEDLKWLNAVILGAELQGQWRLVEGTPEKPRSPESGSEDDAGVRVGLGGDPCRGT